MTSAHAHPDQMTHIEQVLAQFEQLESQFQTLRDGLTHSHRLATLGTIASMVAHEYNNILTPVITYAQLALSKPDDHELMTKAVEKALAGALRAAHISSSMLGFARDSDQRVFADLRNTIAEAIACLGREPGRDGIELEVQIPPVVVAMSPLNLQQVFVNLILNARQAMRRTGGKLSITGRVKADQIHVQVADTGPGIPAAIIHRIFEPFVSQRPPETPGSAPGIAPGPAAEYDAEHATATHAAEGRGTGLGLCICRDLMRSAGGSIAVNSKSGQGTTFHLHIPLADEPFETT